MRSSLIFLLLMAAVAGSAAAQSGPEPVLNCVTYNPNTSFVTAYWGYANTNPTTTTTPIGPSNFFEPPPSNQGQPTKFSSGVFQNVYSTSFTLAVTTTQIWNLSGFSATASNNPAQYCSPAPPQQADLIASDAASNGFFGTSVALSQDGNTALTGAYGGGGSQGRAYVWTRSGGVWTQQAELTASDAAAGDQFGWSVSLSADGNTALLGANGKNSSTGVAYVFTRSGGTWTQQAELRAADGAGKATFGTSVALSGDGKTALIGANGKNSSQGAAYVFVGSSGTWTQQGKLLATDGAAGDGFGVAVSLSGNGTTALVGADERSSRQGAAYVFTASGGTWAQQAELTSADAAGGDQFGNAVSLSRDGNTAVIGAYTKTATTAGCDDCANPMGTAYMFARAGGVWSQQAELFSNFVLDTSWAIGQSVALSGDGTTAVIGAPGLNSAWVAIQSGGTWSFRQTELAPADGGAGFGNAVAISSDGTALVGAPNANSNTGAAYVFFPVTNASLLSEPAGRSFTMTGSGCPSGTLTTPYSGFLSGPCQVTWFRPTSALRALAIRFRTGPTEERRTREPSFLSPPRTPS